MREALPPDIQRFEPTPFGRLELIRHGIGEDFKYAGDLGAAVEFFDEDQCDVIKKKDDKVKMDRLAVIMGMRKLIKQLTGISLEDLIHEANNGTSGFDPGHRALKKRIRNQMYEKLPFFRRYTPEAQDIGFQELSREANDLFDKLKSNRCYKNARTLDMINEVRNCDDPAKLLLFAFDDRVSDDEPKTKKHRARKRFEAARKFLSMMDIAEAKSHVDPNINHQNAQEELSDFLGQHIVYPDKLTALYLVADCDENGKALNADFVDNLDGVETKMNRRIQKFLARTMREENEGQPVRTIMSDRIKKPIDLVVKAYDANSDIASRDVDRNGQSFTFRSRKEWEYFFDKFISELKINVITNTHKRLVSSPGSTDLAEGLDQLESLQKAQLVQVRGPKKEDGSPGDIYGMYLSRKEMKNGELICSDPEAFFTNLAAKAGKARESEDYQQEKGNIDDTIVIYQVKDNLEGKGEFNASREAGSPDLAVYKFKIEIRGSDEKREIRHHEVQIHLAIGVADSEFRLGVSHESYSIKRANKVGKVFWPQEIYEIDHEQAQKDAMASLRKELGFISQDDFNDVALAAE